MGLFRSDNDNRRARISELVGLIYVANREAAEASQRLTTSMRILDGYIEEMSKKKDFAASSIPPETSAHWIPSFSIEGAKARPWTMTALQSILIAGGSASVAARALTALRAGIVTDAVAAMTYNLARNAGFAIPAEQVSLIEGAVPLLRQAGRAGQAARALVTAIAGLAAAAALYAVTEAFLDEWEYRKLMDTLKDVGATRYVCSVYAFKIKGLARAFESAAKTAEIFAKNNIPFDCDKLMSELAENIKAETADAVRRTYEINIELDKQANAYTAGDPSQKELESAYNTSLAQNEKKLNRVIEEVGLSAGWVVDSLQVGRLGGDRGIKWGGGGGAASTLKIPNGKISSISWQPARYGGEKCLHDLQIETSSGTTTYGNPSGHSEVVADGPRVVVKVPAGWRVADIVGTDKAEFAVSSDGSALIKGTPFVRDIYVIGELSPSR